MLFLILTLNVIVFTANSTPIPTTDIQRYRTSPAAGESTNFPGNNSSAWSRGDKIALGVGLPGLVIAIVAVAIAYKQKREGNCNLTVPCSIIEGNQDGTDGNIGLRTITEMAGHSNYKLSIDHIWDVIDLLGSNDYNQLNSCLVDKKFTYADIENAEKRYNTQVDTRGEATNVFLAWMKEKENVTLQMILAALEKCRNILAKTNLETKWKTLVNTEPEVTFEEQNIKDVIDELGAADLTSLFGRLGLDDNFITKNRKADRSDVQQKEFNVLQSWIAKKPEVNVTHLLTALEQAGNKNAAEELRIKWKIPKDYRVPGSGQVQADSTDDN